MIGTLLIGASNVLLEFEATELGEAYSNGRRTCAERAGVGSGQMYELVVTRVQRRKK